MSLKNLIALQRQKESQGEAKPDAGATISGGHEDAAGESETVAASEVPSDAVPSADSPAPEPVPAEAPKRSGLGLNLVGAGRAVGSGHRSGNPVNVGNAPASGGKSDLDSGKDDGAVFGLADLAAFEANDDTAPAKSPVQLGEGFLDEIEATAPDRELEPDLTKQQSEFVESLDGIYSVLNDADLFGQAVRTVMLELQENPEYIKLIQDQDVHTMIRGMRNTMGLAKIRKQEKSRKSGTSTRKAARSKSAVSDEDMALLDSVMGGMGDD